jgi:hypothetical protein
VPLIFASIALTVRIRGDMGSHGPRPNGLGLLATSSLRRPGISRVMPIAVTTWPDEAKRTSNSACVWIAEATVEGRIHIARSRHGPANELARQLVAAGLLDRPMVIRCRGLAGCCANGAGADPRAPCGSAATQCAMRPRPPSGARSSAGYSTAIERSDNNVGREAAEKPRLPSRSMQFDRCEMPRRDEHEQG